jgi:hypothetical protein
MWSSETSKVSISLENVPSFAKFPSSCCQISKKICEPEVFHIFLNCVILQMRHYFLFHHIMACRSVARQPPRNKQLAREELFFLCGPCRDIISRTTEGLISWLVSEWVRGLLRLSLWVVAIRSWYLRHGDSSGTQRNRNVRRWKQLPSNGSEDVTLDTSVCVTVNCKV